MNPFITVLLLVLAITAFTLMATKIGIASPTMMVIGGLVLSFLTNKFQVNLQPDLQPQTIFTIFLPPLLYGAAWQMSWRDFWENRRTILLLSVGLVLFTTAGMAGLAMAFIPGFTWASAFALGAIVSPPDALAVTSMTKKIRLPRRLVMVLEGESLLNDASALVALNFAVKAVETGQFSAISAVGHFGLASIGGISMGLAIGWLVSKIHQWLRDPLIETAITFLTPYAAYLFAEHLELSGVLATVTAGLYVSWRAPIVMKPQSRLDATAVWAFVLFILNGFAFVKVGLGLPSVLNELPDFSTGQLIEYGCLLVGGMIVLRMVWVMLGVLIVSIMSKRRHVENRTSFRQSVLLGWVGMRGVVTLAAALSLPLTVGGGNFPNRGLIIFVAFFTILVTLVLQSLTLPMVVHLLGIRTNEDEEAEERQARLHATRTALSFLKELTDFTDAFGDAGKELVTEYEHRIARLETGPAMLPLMAVGIETSGKDLARAVLSAERQAIVEMRADQKISIELYQRLMADVDAEELRLPSRA